MIMQSGLQAKAKQATTIWSQGVSPQDVMPAGATDSLCFNDDRISAAWDKIASGINAEGTPISRAQVGRYGVVLDLIEDAIHEWQEQSANACNLPPALILTRIDWMNDFFLPMSRAMLASQLSIDIDEASAAVSIIFNNDQTRRLAANLSSLLLELNA